MNTSTTELSNALTNAFAKAEVNGKLINSLAIMLNGDQTTDLRRSLFFTAKQYVKNYAERVLLEGELNTLPDLRAQTTKQIDAKESLLTSQLTYTKTILHG